MTAVRVKELSAPRIDRGEILRYMGCRGGDDEIEALIDRSLSLCSDKLTYRVCYREYDIQRSDGYIDLGFAVTRSRDLAKALDGCHGIVLFAATVGLELDRLIYKYSRTQPSVALCLQAIGAERIEALCNDFCAFLGERGFSTRPRFSAGYGDLPLSLQRDIFACLECPRHIGLTLNDSLLMSPTKSVTAIVGIEKNENT